MQEHEHGNEKKCLFDTTHWEPGELPIVEINGQPYRITKILSEKTYRAKPV